MALRPLIIDTSDQRCAYLYQAFMQDGFQTIELNQKTDQLGLYQSCILVFPPQKLITLEDVKRLKEGSAVFGGQAEQDAKIHMSQSGISYFNLLKDETYTIKNTLPTAEGALSLLIENTNRTLKELSILILGYGRVGKALAGLLSALGCRLSIYSMEEKERAHAFFVAQTIYADPHHLKQADVIVNTVPANILCDEDFDHLSSDTLLIDLASGDYLELGRRTGIRTIKASGLPGKYAPQSAGMYMKDCILSILNANAKLKSIYLVSHK